MASQAKAPLLEGDRHISIVLLDERKRHSSPISAWRNHIVTPPPPPLLAKTIISTTRKQHNEWIYTD